MEKDDIDDLLDEVESKYMRKMSKPSPKLSTTTSSRVTALKKNSGLEEAIDDLLDLDMNELSHKRGGGDVKKATTTAVQSLPRVDTPRRSCLPVYLGGTSVNTGRGASVSQLACDQLRCTSCDFRICFFDNMAWAKDTDYLFLRNNAPDFQRLKSKLIRKRGVRAYCCQCSWRNIQDLIIHSDPQLKWVCGKHAS